MRLQFQFERKRQTFFSVPTIFKKSIVSDTVTVTAVSETAVIPDGIMSNI